MTYEAHSRNKRFAASGRADRFHQQQARGPWPPNNHRSLELPPNPRIQPTGWTRAWFRSGGAFPGGPKGTKVCVGVSMTACS
jgi:hypothetical protein